MIEKWKEMRNGNRGACIFGGVTSIKELDRAHGTFIVSNDMAHFSTACLCSSNVFSIISSPATSVIRAPVQFNRLRKDPQTILT